MKEKEESDGPESDSENSSHKSEKNDKKQSFAEKHKGVCNVCYVYGTIGTKCEECAIGVQVYPDKDMETKRKDRLENVPSRSKEEVKEEID